MLASLCIFSLLFSYELPELQLGRAGMKSQKKASLLIIKNAYASVDKEQRKLRLNSVISKLIAQAK